MRGHTLNKWIVLLFSSLFYFSTLWSISIHLKILYWISYFYIKIVGISLKLFRVILPEVKRHLIYEGLPVSTCMTFGQVGFVIVIFVEIYRFHIISDKSRRSLVDLLK